MTPSAAENDLVKLVKVKRQPRPRHAFVPGVLSALRCGHRGDSSVLCHLPESAHRPREDRREERRARRGAERERVRRRDQRREREALVVFWDTEGQGEGEKHRLLYGAAVDERGETIVEVEGKRDSLGRVTEPHAEDWLEGLLEVGRRTGVWEMFGYGLGYDRTMMLRKLPARVRWLLTRRDRRPLAPERKAKNGRVTKRKPMPIYAGRYKLDLQGSVLSVSRIRVGADGKRVKKKGRVVWDTMRLWDTIKFYQCGFCDALDQWRRRVDKGQNLDSKLDVPEEDMKRMRLMKEQREHFDKLDWEEVKRYCRTECVYGARLIRELKSACERIGVDLKRYDGAGSISDALLKKFHVEKYMSAQNAVCRWTRDSVLRPQLDAAVMGAFFGGRFEAAYCGVVRNVVYERDICSAYPYAMSQLPCLACGRWERITETARRRDGVGSRWRIDEATLALVKVRTWGRGREKSPAYGSLPHRCKEGNIRFPVENETWVWKPEYLAARDDFKDRVEVLEAFVYNCDCDHRPFSWLPQLYVERLRIGKEGRGIALKLGCNGCAGKTMQQIGSHRWQEYIWAGNTTSTTRAQLLTGLSLHADPWDVCYMATDSLFATSRPELPKPINTHTHVEAQRRAGVAEKNLKPALGDWEEGEPFHKGMVFVRPGIAFPYQATEEQKKRVKARGIAKGVMLKEAERITQFLLDRDTVLDETAKLDFLARRVFGGMKMTTSRRVARKNEEGTEPDDKAPRGYVYRAAGPRYELDRDGEEKLVGGYACWYEQPIQLSVAPKPKRYGRLPGEAGQLLAWPRMPYPSVAYRDAKRSKEVEGMDAQRAMLDEQPDGVVMGAAGMAEAICAAAEAE